MKTKLEASKSRFLGTKLAFLCASACVCTQIHAQNISTIAAQIAVPKGVAVDAVGNVYIAEVTAHRIDKVSNDGTITIVAGNGTSGYSGDGGPATSAQLYYPFDVAVDASGNLYIADYSNYRVRKVATNGTITTVAGGGTRGYEGSATSAQLFEPTNVTVDAAGNLYIVDAVYVLKVTTGGMMSIMAGGGFGSYYCDGESATDADFGAPSDIAVDSSGNLYISLPSPHTSGVCEVTTDGKIKQIAGNRTQGYSGDGGPAMSAALNRPAGLFLDTTGNLYIADSGNNVIRKVATDGTITTVAGNGTKGYSGDGGPAVIAQLDNPYDVSGATVGDLFIADTDNRCVRKVKFDEIFKNGFE